MTPVYQNLRGHGTVGVTSEGVNKSLPTNIISLYVQPSSSHLVKIPSMTSLGILKQKTHLSLPSMSCQLQMHKHQPQAPPPLPPSLLNSQQHFKVQVHRSEAPNSLSRHQEMATHQSRISPQNPRLRCAPNGNHALPAFRSQALRRLRSREKRRWNQQVANRKMNHPWHC